VAYTFSPLSSANPYVGGNVILGREAEQSEYLYNFLSGRGAPAAIRLSGDGEMQLYYPRQKELYIANATQMGESVEWVVNGPYAIPRAEYKALGRLAMEPAGEPLFMIDGRHHRFGAVRPDTRPPVLSPTIAVLPPTPTAAPKRPKPMKRAPAAPVIKAEAPTPTPKPFTPLTFDQQAIAMSQGYAERSENGDVVHNVTADGETLASIAAWYAGDPQHEEAIARANGLTKGATVTKGARISVPMGIVKNFKRKQ